MVEEYEHPVVLMSCKEQYNKDLFLEEVGEMTATLKGKQLYALKYPSWEHNDRLNWLVANASVAHTGDQMVEVSEDGQEMTFEVLLDDVVYQRYLKQFEPALFQG